MPYANGIIYSEVVNGEKVGINTDEIGAVLGENSHDVGTLGRSQKVNKWNKNKPYRRTAQQVPERNVNVGNRGATNNFPVYWGLQYPMNTAGQTASGLARATLLELCYDVSQQNGVGDSSAGRGHKNYDYQKPVVDVDFCSEDDFDGYSHKAGPFLDAGVAGANPGVGKPAEMSINRFDNSSLDIYAMIPSDSYLFGFKDLVPNPGEYYLVAEFYKVNDWKVKGTATPFLIARSSSSLNATGMSIVLSVSTADIISAGGLSTTEVVSFYVCVGFNRLVNNAWQSGAAFVAPWSYGAQKCATKVTLQTVAPYLVTVSKYAFNPSYDSSYKDFPSSRTTATSPNMYFKGTLQNNGTTTLKIYTENSAIAGGLIFRARAIGSYGAYHNDNAGHTSAGGDDSNGAWRTLRIGTTATVGNTTTSIEVAAQAQKTIYFCADALLPYGETTGIVIQVSNDKGQGWSTVGTKWCYFHRVP